MVVVTDPGKKMRVASEDQFLSKRSGLIKVFEAIIATVDASFVGYDEDEYNLELQLHDYFNIPRISITLGTYTQLTGVSRTAGGADPYFITCDPQKMRCIHVVFPKQADTDNPEDSGSVCVLRGRVGDRVKSGQHIKSFKNAAQLKVILDKILETKDTIARRRLTAVGLKAIKGKEDRFTREVNAIISPMEPKKELDDVYSKYVDDVQALLKKIAKGAREGVGRLPKDHVPPDPDKIIDTIVRELVTTHHAEGFRERIASMPLETQLWEQRQDKMRDSDKNTPLATTLARRLERLGFTDVAH